MSDTVTNFTPEQNAAIKYRGGSLLVSAAAGSGKTKVLVERLLSRIEQGDDIDEFLVITYTRAAALELRERIYEEIMSKLTKSPGNKRLRRQAMLCRGAAIDTIHTFCSDILRENAHLIGLSPDFRVCDEIESNFVKNETLDKVLNEAYERADDHQTFQTLIDMLIEGRNDSRLVEIIMDIHSRLQSTPNPHNWIESENEKLKQVGELKSVTDTVYGTQLMVSLEKTIKYYSAEMNRLLQEIEELPEVKEKYGESVEITCKQLSVLLSAIGRGWDEAAKHRNIEFRRTKPLKGYDELKAIRSICKEEIGKATAILENSSEEHLEDIRKIAPTMAKLLMLTYDFDREYAEEKKKRSLVDFSDLEHLTLSLLIDHETKKRSNLAKNVSKRFKEILVDEYQDVNAVQEQIFSAISKNESNIFMVGDVKQSIYRFRLADPSIFLSKYKEMGEYNHSEQETSSSDSRNVKIHLSKNFRSSPEVLETVNVIFGNIMSEDFGEMEYTEKEKLLLGRVEIDEKKGMQGKQGISQQAADNTTKIPVEFDVINLKNLLESGEKEPIDPIQIEACHVTDKIETLMESGFTIPDSTGKMRKIEYSDIVILLRSVKGKAWKFASALNKSGIPTNLPGGDSYFDTQEMRTILSILIVINNPMQDIPLATAMRSIVYRFSENELAQIRADLKHNSFYDAVKRSADCENENDELACKCREFITDIEKYRVVLPDMSADRFIWHVYNKTGLPERVRALKNGSERCQNLVALAEYASRYEQSGYKGIYMFLNHIENLRERGYSVINGKESKNNASQTDNSVQIMSIHKSKGMEFPIVFLVNTSSKLNYRDISNSIVFHAKLGIGATMLDKTRRIKYNTLQKIAIQRKLAQEMKSEELRVLYVAMTRAREKLIITSTLRNPNALEKKLSIIPVGKIPPPLISELSSMAEWILAGVQNEKSDAFTVNYIDAATISMSSEELKTDIEDDVNNTIDETKWELAIGQAPKKSGTDQTSENSILGRQPKKHLPNTKNESSEEKDTTVPEYQYALASMLPSKLTVTKLKQLAQDSEAQVAPWLREKQIAISPSFVGNEAKTTATERGVLMHLVIQHADLDKCSRDNEIREELQRLVNKGFIDKKTSSEVDIEGITRFCNSDIGKRIASSKSVRKEFKFSLLTDAEDFFSGGGDDKILLQGVIDCYFEEDDELVLVDYKTDKVTDRTVSEKAENYRPQLDAYATALQRITGKKVKERIIYFFALGKEMSLSL